MTGFWERAGRRAAIGCFLVVAGWPSPGSADERVLRKEVVVDAPVDRVWHAWTTPEGIAGFFSPASRIELKIGGAYDLYMRMEKPDETGRRGSEGCKVLSYNPHEMLSFEWNFPPSVMSLRKSFAKTHVVLHFEPLDGGKTRVRFAQSGWKSGDDWDKGYAYFDKAWGMVMKQLQENVRGVGTEPDDAPAGKSWVDGHVTVTSYAKPLKRQDFEMTIPAPVTKVWDTLATTKGLRSLGGKDATVELRPGGKYSFWPGSPVRVLCYVPFEILSVSGSAPPKFPNVQKGGTWGTYFFDKIDEKTTRLRLVCIGWRPGEKEWDDAFDYFLKNNPIFLNDVYDKIVGKNGKEEKGAVLRHDVIIDAPVADVWKALTTKKGVESWMVAHAEIDLRVGGKMLTHYDPNGVIGDPNTIENTILSYEPQRMISIKATKPPENFPLKEAIKDMWTVVRMEPVDERHTRVICTSMGFQADEDSQKLRAHFDKGNAWTLQKLREWFATKTDAEAQVSAEMPERPSMTPEFQSYLSHVAAASALLKLGETGQAQRWVAQAPADWRNWEWRYLNASLDQSTRTWADQGEAVMSVAFSPDGAQIAEGISDGKALIRDAKDGKLIRTLNGHEKALWHVTFDADGKRLATSSSDGVAKIWDVASGNELIAIKHEKTQVYSASFSPDGRRLATSMLGFVKLWDSESGKKLKTLSGHNDRPPVTRVVFSPDGSLLASASWDNNVIIWDAESGREMHKLGPGYGGGEYTPYNAVVWNPDGTRVAACSGTKTIWVWNASTGKVVKKWTAHEKDIFALAFDSSGRRLASGGSDLSLCLWDATTGKNLASLRGHTNSIRSACFSPDDSMLVSGAADKSVKFWCADGRSPDVVIRCEKGVWAAPFSPDSALIATASSDHSARVWDARTGEQLTEFTGLPEQVARVTFSPDGRYLAAGSNDPVVRIWDWKEKKLVHEMKGHKGGVPMLDYSPDGKTLATTSYDKTIRLWNTETGKELRTIQPSKGYSYSIGFNPDGKTIASADYDNRVRLWDIETGSEVLSLEGHRQRAMSVAFSRDGKKLAAAGYDEAVRIWELPSGRPLHAMTGHDNQISGLAFSPDGTRLASCSNDHTVKLWDVSQGTEVATLVRADESIYAVAFSPDGTRLSATLVDGRVLLLDSIRFADRLNEKTAVN